MRIFHRRRSLLRQLGCKSLLLILATASLRAQVVRDNSIGPKKSGGSLKGPNYQIPANLGERKGANLFHSFRKFDLQMDDSATFTAEGARNILARVTGRTASSINGAINSDANLFLMNPAGIVFHESASIDVNGTFFATTADYIKLGNGGHFAAAKNPEDSVLSVSAPSAFGFLNPKPAPIGIRGSEFKGTKIKTLGFIGGDVSITGDAVLQAEDVQIVSVRSAGEAALRLPTASNGLRYASMNADNFSQRGSVKVGSPTRPGQAPSRATVTANRVVIRGGTLVMKNAEVTASAAHPGDGISVQAADKLSMGDRSGLVALNDADFRDQTTIDISARAASLADESQILSLTSDLGSGGNVRLNVDGTLSMTADASIVTQSGSPDRGGDLYVSAGDLSMDGSGVISQVDDLVKAGDVYLKVEGSLSLANGAAVYLTPSQSSNEQIVAAAENITISGRSSGLFFLDQSPDGIGGSIKVTARENLSLFDGGVISAETVSRAGAAIEIHAGNVLISGAGSSDRSTGIIADTVAGPGTHGGDIRMDVAGSLQVLDGGVISTNTKAQGNGGNIVIAARDVLVAGPAAPTPFEVPIMHGITAQNVPLGVDSPSGDSGSIRLAVSGRLEVRSGGALVVDTRGAGRSGNIDIKAKNGRVSSAGIIAARTFGGENGGRGGDLTIDVSDRWEVSEGGQLNAGTFGSGIGGTISIRGNEIVMNGKNARISAVSGGPHAFALGAGGNVLIGVDRLKIENDAQILASTYGLGAGGNVDITAKSVDVNDGDEAFFAGISAETLSPSAGGAGGRVRIDAGSITMRGAGAALTTQSLGAGQSGRIQVTTATLGLSDGSAIQSSSSGAGNAGSITIEARGGITLDSGSSLSVASTQANAGDIHIRSESSITFAGGSLTAQAASNGGNIDVRARETLFLTNSQLTGAAGLNGGNIFIDPQLVVLEDSLISANAIRGRGGNIRIISDFFLATNSKVTATSELGIDGRVRIDALNHHLTGSLVELPSSLINAESLLQELCTMKVDKFSSFISEGRGGLPPLPGDALPSFMIVR